MQASSLAGDLPLKGPRAFLTLGSALYWVRGMICIQAVGGDGTGEACLFLIYLLYRRSGPSCFPLTFSLARTQSHVHFNFQGILGNVCMSRGSPGGKGNVL